MTNHLRVPVMRRAPSVLAWAMLMSVAGCKSLVVPDYNASSLNDLKQTPTASAVAAAATGVVAGSRLMNNLPPVSYLELVTMMGRESYTLDPSFSPEPPRRLERNESTTAASVWGRMYVNMQQENILLSVLDNTAGLSTAEKDAIRGFLKTFQAFDLLMVINMFDAAGAIIDLKSDPAGDPAPVATKAQTLTRIAQLLDEGKTSLATGGARFPMSLGGGFTDFNTPAKFLQFNRALRARVAVYLGDYGVALTALGESFLSTSASLNLGAYHAYSTNSGDLTNPFYDPLPRIFYAHPSFRADAQLKADGTKDNRMLAKIAPITPKTQLGYAVSDRITLVPTSTSPLAIIRNEELILLRAEANLGLGNTAPAIQDINFIRVNSGGLPPISNPYVPAAGQPPTLLDELLYEKRYSLYWEGHRWIDMRRYGKLAQLPHDTPAAKVFPYFPLPDAECVPRSLTCVAPAGF